MPDSATQSYKPHVLVDTKDLPESDWLEYRRRGIGGSDAASILGVSPFRTARDLYYDKLKIVTYAIMKPRLFKIAQVMIILLSQALDSSTVFPLREKFIKSSATAAVTTAAIVEIRRI